MSCDLLLKKVKNLYFFWGVGETGGSGKWIDKRLNFYWEFFFVDIGFRGGYEYLFDSEKYKGC